MVTLNKKMRDMLQNAIEKVLVNEGIDAAVRIDTLKLDISNSRLFLELNANGNVELGSLMKFFLKERDEENEERN